MKELREFIDLMDNIQAGQPVVQEDAVDLVQLADMLDELDEKLRQAINIANDLARFGKDLPGPFAGQIRSYLEPHLESFLGDDNQPGSIPSLRSMLASDKADEDNENQ